MNAPICLLHGWAANRHIFKDFSRLLREHGCDTTAWDLPGHGGQPFNGTFNLRQTADDFAAQIHTPQHLFGWSLGGLTALLLAARHPEKVKTLTICAGFAKLLATPDYPEGLNQLSLAKMVGLFQQDYPKYMRQFLELQLMHSANRAEILAAVLPDTVQHGTPQALQAALDALEEADARTLLPDLHTPTLLLYGSKDTITPPRMGEYLAQHLPKAQLHIIDRAAHAPFLSHAEETAQVFINFIRQHD